MEDTGHSFWGVFVAMLAIAWTSYNLSQAAWGNQGPSFAKPKDFSRFEGLGENRELFDQVALQAMTELRKRKLLRYLPALFFLVVTALTLTTTTQAVSIFPEVRMPFYDTMTGGTVMIVGLTLAHWGAGKLEARLLSSYISKILDGPTWSTAE